MLVYLILFAKPNILKRIKKRFNKFQYVEFDFSNNGLPYYNI